MFSKGSTKTLRLMNRALILDLVRERGPLSRADLAGITGLTRSAVSAIVADLVQTEELTVTGIGENRIGRKAVLYAYDANTGFVLGLGIGPSKPYCVIADMNGNVIGKEHWELPAAASSGELLDELCTRVERFCGEMSLDLSRLRAIGVASPGIVDDNAGRVIGAAPNLPGWEDLPLGDLVHARFGVPVLVENDVRCALAGEVRFGVAAGLRNAAFLFVDTGLGASLLLDGKLYRGSHFAAGELGYWLTGRESLHRQWKPKGNLETVVGAPGVAARAEALLSHYPESQLAARRGGLTAADVFAAAASGDPMAKAVVRETAEYLGLTVANLSSLLDLDVVILGGSVMRSADQLLDEIRTLVERHVPTPLEVLVSQIPEEAAGLGAMHLALERLQSQTRTAGHT